MPAAIPITLTGFNFLPGATATVGGLPATNVAVTNYNTISLTTPSLPCRQPQRHHGDEHRYERRNASQRLDRQLPGCARKPAVQPVRDDARAQRDHRRRRRRQLRGRAEHQAAADGGFPAQVEVRHLLHAAALHRPGLSRRALHFEFRSLDQRARRAGHHDGLRRRQLLPRQSGQPPADGACSC